ncbi:Dyp-type peroxidase [Streptomyces sp. NPDC001678]|uniref:Dyp-type peroxidase n=1 Tax=Streptomyces sp. NPDC001678 TaxID=3364599 RepID=UPI0036A9D5F4
MALDLAATRSQQWSHIRQLALMAASQNEHGTTAGIALGVGLFDRAELRPRQLRVMPVFPGDLLDAHTSNGEVLVQIAGRSREAVAQAAGRLLEGASAWRKRWQIDGFRAGNRVVGNRGLARNPFHFTEGFGNPAGERETLDRALVRAGQGEPDWAVGGSYQVLRIVRCATDLWDAEAPEEQERVIGRRKDGQWLDGSPAGEEPGFAADPRGKITPLDSHVRLAAPDRRRPPPLVRRSYSYDRGDGDTGLIFSCFQRDLAQGFEAVQRRLAGDALAKYVLTVGGGYFFVPPNGHAWTDVLAR